MTLTRPTTATSGDRRWRWMEIALVLAGVIAIGSLVQLASSTLGTAGVVERPQHYVAMDFARPTDLPEFATPFQAFSVPVRVSSTETATRKVPWELQVEEGGRPVEVHSGGVVVQAHGAAVIRPAFSAPLEPGEYRVVFRLPGEDLTPLEFAFTVAVRQLP